jgi:hypothetical protein
MKKGLFGFAFSAVVLKHLQDLIDGVVGIIKNGHRLLLLFFIINQTLIITFDLPTIYTELEDDCFYL